MLIADTAYELYAACETIKDMDELYEELGIEDDAPNGVMNNVCKPQLPNAADVWDGILENTDQ